jgi:hypothetical protein
MVDEIEDYISTLDDACSGTKYQCVGQPVLRTYVKGLKGDYLSCIDNVEALRQIFTDALDCLGSNEVSNPYLTQFVPRPDLSCVDIQRIITSIRQDYDGLTKSMASRVNYGPLDDALHTCLRTHKKTSIFAMRTRPKRSADTISRPARYSNRLLSNTRSAAEIDLDDSEAEEGEVDYCAPECVSRSTMPYFPQSLAGDFQGTLNSPKIALQIIKPCKESVCHRFHVINYGCADMIITRPCGHHQI